MYSVFSIYTTKAHDICSTVAHRCHFTFPPVIISGKHFAPVISSDKHFPPVITGGKHEWLLRMTCLRTKVSVIGLLVSHDSVCLL